MIRMPVKFRCGHIFWTEFNAQLKDCPCPRCGKPTAKPAWVIGRAQVA